MMLGDWGNSQSQVVVVVFSHYCVSRDSGERMRCDSLTEFVALVPPPVTGGLLSLFSIL